MTHDKPRKSDPIDKLANDISIRKHQWLDKVLTYLKGTYDYKERTTRGRRREFERFVKTKCQMKQTKQPIHPDDDHEIEYTFFARNKPVSTLVIKLTKNKDEDETR